MQPTRKSTEIFFTNGDREIIGSSGSMVLEHGGWVSITDRITDFQLGGYLQRTRSFPPSAIRVIVHTRKEED